jgi:hypothetical protein
MSHMKSNRSSGHIVGAILTLVFAASAVWLYVNQQYVLDQVSAWQYQPTAEVQAIPVRAGLNDQARFLLYSSHASIDDAQKFNQECSRVEQNSATLGCYTGNRIYVYNITDARLDGIKEVTASHEMLHAAYQRLSTDERKKVNVLLEAEYLKLKNNKDFADRMAIYARSEPDQRDNELHSIIGTEIQTISPELETYYTKYFTDRHKVTALYGQYQAIFSELAAKSTSLSDEMKVLGDQIAAKTQAYNTAVKQLNTAISDFNNKAMGGGFSSQDEFNSARAALVVKVRQLDAQRTSVNNDIVTYQRLYKELQAIASQSDALNRSIDSSLAPAPQI